MQMHMAKSKAVLSLAFIAETSAAGYVLGRSQSTVANPAPIQTLPGSYLFPASPPVPRAHQSPQRIQEVAVPAVNPSMIVAIAGPQWRQRPEIVQERRSNVYPLCVSRMGYSYPKGPIAQLWRIPESWTLRPRRRSSLLQWTPTCAYASIFNCQFESLQLENLSSGHLSVLARRHLADGIPDIVDPGLDARP